MLTVLCEECHNLFHSNLAKNKTPDHQKTKKKELKRKANHGSIKARAHLKRIKLSGGVKIYTQEEIASLATT
jgi:hypothetical protein